HHPDLELCRPDEVLLEQVLIIVDLLLIRKGVPTVDDLRRIPAYEGPAIIADLMSQPLDVLTVEVGAIDIEVALEVARPDHVFTVGGNRGFGDVGARMRDNWLEHRTRRLRIGSTAD